VSGIVSGIVYIRVIGIFVGAQHNKMDSQHNKIVSAERVPFFSNAKDPFNGLSNFHACEFTLGGITYPSSEHAFQAQLVPPNYRHIFSVTGPLATLDSGFRTLMPRAKEADIEKKVLFWGRKKNVGIVAKMASRRDYLLLNYGLRKADVGFDECRIIFKSVLVAKHDSSAEFRELLEGTGDKYLFEFDRAAERMSLKGSPLRWAAMIKDNRVIGHNQMGSLLMWLRDFARDKYL